MDKFIKEDRLRSILEYGMDCNLVSAKDLAVQMKVSPRTIRNDIKNLNLAFQNVASFKNENGVYKFCIFDKKKFNWLLEGFYGIKEDFNFTSQRVAYIIEKLMQSEKPCLIDNLAEEMNVSRSTLNLDLKSARNVLSPFNIEIIGKPNIGLELVGEECGIRMFTIENIYDFVYTDYKLDVEIVDIVNTKMQQYGIESVTKDSFLKFLVVMLDRFLNNHPIKHFTNGYMKIIKSPLFNYVKSVVKEVELYLHINIPLEEQVFLAFPIIGMNMPTSMNSLDNVPIDREIYALIEEIFKQLEQELNLSFFFNETPLDFAYHLMFMLNRLQFNYRLKNDFSDEVKQKYPLSYKMACITGRTVEKIYNFKVPEDELGYIASYYGTFLIEHKMKVSRNCKIAVVCSTGRITAKLVAVQLKSVLNCTNNIDLFSDAAAAKEILLNYDMVFSTVKLQFQIEKPVIYINPVNPIINVDEIYQKIEKAKFSDQLNLSSLNNNSALIINLFQSDCFFVLDSNKSYRQNSDMMIENLTEKELLDRDFLYKISERESQSSMVFENGLAFPHMINHAANKPVLALGVFRKPIRENGKSVKVIFVMGVPYKKDIADSLLIRIYEEIIKISQNAKMVDEISKLKSYDELLNYFYNL